MTAGWGAGNGVPDALAAVPTPGWISEMAAAKMAPTALPFAAVMALKKMDATRAAGHHSRLP